MVKKIWWRSKTLWANGIALGLAFLAQVTGTPVDAEISVSILAVLNFILRVVTKQGLTA